MAKEAFKKVENKGNKGAPEDASTFRGKDAYVKTGMTAGMHGKAKGGHPTKRAQEMC